MASGAAPEAQVPPRTSISEKEPPSPSDAATSATDGRLEESIPTVAYESASSDEQESSWPKGWRPYFALIGCFFLMWNSWGLVNAYGIPFHHSVKLVANFPRNLSIILLSASLVRHEHPPPQSHRIIGVLFRIGAIFHCWPAPGCWISGLSAWCWKCSHISGHVFAGRCQPRYGCWWR